MDDIPIIDIAPFLSGGAGSGAVVARVAAACRATGFFLITGHGVPEQATALLYEQARMFFDRGAALREPGAPDQLGGLGFARLGTEALAATSDPARRQAGDQKQSLNYGPRLPGGDWPADPPLLRPAFTACFAAMDVLAASLRRLFCAAIGLRADFFEPDFAGHLSALRVIDYPEPKAPPLPGQLRAGTHTDYGFLTILRSDASAGGLQVRARDGAWLDAPSLDGAFVINIGDALMRWTNGVWQSTPHRVANPPSDRRHGSRRQSIAFFHNPNQTAVLRCLEAFQLPGEPARYEPIRYGDYIALKTRQAFQPVQQKASDHAV